MRLRRRGTPAPRLERIVLGRVTCVDLDAAREQHVLLRHDLAAADLAGYAGAVGAAPLSGQVREALPVPAVDGVATLDDLAPGDVVALHPDGEVATLYRRASPHNTLLLTERCNSFCLMCSQPPRPSDDGSLLERNLRLVDLIDPDTRELGLSGGEPTLLKDDLVTLIRRCRERLPHTALHLLSNGRLFCYGSFARRLAEVGHPDLMVGVPLYSDVDSEHDYVVQARGAFDDTLVGLHNLARFGVAVEVRVVVHRLTWRRLARLAEFVYRNLTFASHVALMGLEPIGFAVANLEALWIDPWDYRDELRGAVRFLAARGLRVSIYNHQLCTLPHDLWPFARRSISDWKNEYLPQCAPCRVRAECAGFFASSLQRRTSAQVQPISESALPEA